MNTATLSPAESAPLALPLTAEAKTGVVVIGRNEGARLEKCLESLSSLRGRVVYVDSGSTDGSVALAEDRGVVVVNLDMALPFTAARARNAGFWELLRAHPSLEYVFFVDGDCEVVSGWVESAVSFLDDSPKVAVVFGYRRERFPTSSIYNRICDLEWQDIPVGESKTCGGDIVARVAAIKEVDGYRPDMICGEEPEMCIRLRQRDWLIWRIDKNMTVHDAAMKQFGQWWKRSMRGGFGYAQGAHIHGTSPQRHWVSEYRRTWMWGLVLPCAIVALSAAISWKLLLLFGLYPLQMVRIALNGHRTPRENWLRAGALILGKFPEMLGQVQYLRDRFLHVQSRLIEYK